MANILIEGTLIYLIFFNGNGIPSWTFRIDRGITNFVVLVKIVVAVVVMDDITIVITMIKHHISILNGNDGVTVRRWLKVAEVVGVEVDVNVVVRGTDRSCVCAGLSKCFVKFNIFEIISPKYRNMKLGWILQNLLLIFCNFRVMLHMSKFLITKLSSLSQKKTFYV